MLTISVVQVGMHAALQINPYYGKTSQDGLNAHFDAALAEGPAIIYNVPARTGQDIPDAVVHRLAAHPNFMGVKECTGNARIEVRLPGRGCLFVTSSSCVASALHARPNPSGIPWTQLTRRYVQRRPLPEHDTAVTLHDAQCTSRGTARAE